MPINEISATLEAKGLKTVIVISRFNDFLTKQLLGGAVDCLVRHGAAEEDITVAWVPGANRTPRPRTPCTRSIRLEPTMAYCRQRLTP